MSTGAVFMLTSNPLLTCVVGTDNPTVTEAQWMLVALSHQSQSGTGPPRIAQRLI